MGARQAIVVTDDRRGATRRQLLAELEADRRRPDRRRAEALGVLTGAALATTRLPAVLGSSWTLSALDAALSAAIVAWVVVGVACRVHDALRTEERR
jgi:hypothetical protein